MCLQKQFRCSFADVMWKSVVNTDGICRRRKMIPGIQRWPVIHLLHRNSFVGEHRWRVWNIHADNIDHKSATISGSCHNSPVTYLQPPSPPITPTRLFCSDGKVKQTNIRLLFRRLDGCVYQDSILERAVNKTNVPQLCSLQKINRS